MAGTLRIGRRARCVADPPSVGAVRCDDGCQRERITTRKRSGLDGKVPDTGVLLADPPAHRGEVEPGELDWRDEHPCPRLVDAEANLAIAVDGDDRVLHG